MSYQVIWKQIPVGVKMRLGVRNASGTDAKAGVLSSLTFQVGSKRAHYVEIDLEVSDTYTVRMFKLAKGQRHILDEVSDVYCGELGEVLIGMEGRHLG